VETIDLQPLPSVPEGQHGHQILYKSAKIELGHHSHQLELNTPTAPPRPSHFATLSFYSAISHI
jgi:hypothetical protein